MFYFDPIYFIFLLPAFILAIWAQIKVKSALNEASQVPLSSGLTGAEVAQYILKESHLIDKVGIEVTNGFLGDHYDPKKKVLRLSPDIYHGSTVAAAGVAAHEVGHALQDATNYSLMTIRNAVVPVASFGSNMSFFFIFIGFIMHSFSLIVAGVALFSTVVFFQVVNLPVEFDASKRAKSILLKKGLVTPEESKLVSKVLNAAALTYVAATITAILTLLYYLFRLGLLGGRND